MNVLEKPTRMTPSNAPNKRVEMKPLPIRIASQQYERLSNARIRTGISVQEHIRRAIDIYLVQVEREAMELADIPTQPPAQTPKTARSRPRVQKR